MSQDLEAIGHDVVDCAIKVHQALGPGLLEAAYQYCLAHELKKTKQTGVHGSDFAYCVRWANFGCRVLHRHVVR